MLTFPKAKSNEGGKELKEKEKVKEKRGGKGRKGKRRAYQALYN